MEIWKYITGYENKYQVSNYGRVKNLFTNRCIGSKTKSGYIIANLYKDKKQKGFGIHRLVAQEFLIDYKKDLMVNHIDFNQSNNHIDNLEMVTNRENQCHSVKSKNKYIGVSFHSLYKVWTSQIMINGKLKYIGRFKSEEEAYIARCEFENKNGIVNKYL
jgi:hypothetical protein